MISMNTGVNVMIKNNIMICQNRVDIIGRPFSN